jgi:hypothetical protein
MGPKQTPLPEQLQKYIGELSNNAFNVKTPRTHVKTERVISDLMAILLNSQHHPYENNGIIIDGDELTKDAYKKGMKIYNQQKMRLHTTWALFTTTTIFMITIILVEFN